RRVERDVEDLDQHLAVRRLAHGSLGEREVAALDHSDRARRQEELVVDDVHDPAKLSTAAWNKRSSGGMPGTNSPEKMSTGRLHATGSTKLGRTAPRGQSRQAATCARTPSSPTKVPAVDRPGHRSAGARALRRGS